MAALQEYSLKEIESRLNENCFPFSGITELGSTEFKFIKPSFYIGVVMHAGSRMDPVFRENLLISEQDQFREEDPYMQSFITEFPFQVIARDSRYEYDLNRDPDDAVYPFDRPKYGMRVWKREFSKNELRAGELKHLEFYELMDILIRYMLERNPTAIIFDMHSYCYQREKKQDWYQDPKPGINLGTKAVNREKFGERIDMFMEDLGGQIIENNEVRAAENEVFMGGYLSRRISREYYDRVLVLALEYKKIFMDEWSGELFPDILKLLISHFNHASLRLVKESRGN